MSTNTLAVFISRATLAEKRDFAKRIGSTYAYAIYHLPKSDREGWREPRPELAARIEEVTVAMSRESGGRLPVVWRVELNTACRGCKFAQRCLRDKAIAAEFEVVG